MSDEVWVKLTRDEIRLLQTPRVAVMRLDSADQTQVRQSVHSKLAAALEREGPSHRVFADSFEDDRGMIRDLIDGPIDSVTRITSVKGAVRGNHFHKRTTQWTYLLTGSLLVANGAGETLVRAGDLVVDRPGEPHAWKAVEDTDCLVFTHGPRSGDQYESDVFRLDTPLLT